MSSKETPLITSQDSRKHLSATSFLVAAGSAVAIALDRQEKAKENDVDLPHSAVQYVKKELNMNICAIATLTDLLNYLESAQDPQIKPFLSSVKAYRERYGVDTI